MRSFDEGEGVGRWNVWWGMCGANWTPQMHIMKAMGQQQQSQWGPGYNMVSHGRDGMRSFDGGEVVSRWNVWWGMGGANWTPQTHSVTAMDQQK